MDRKRDATTAQFLWFFPSLVITRSRRATKTDGIKKVEIPNIVCMQQQQLPPCVSLEKNTKWSKKKKKKEAKLVIPFIQWNVWILNWEWVDSFASSFLFCFFHTSISFSRERNKTIPPLPPAVFGSSREKRREMNSLLSVELRSV